MPSFTGEYPARLNAKYQVTLPSDLREAYFALGEDRPMIFFGRETHLELYPFSVWVKAQEKARQIAMETRDSSLTRKMNRSAYSVKVEEGGNGRLLIPQAFQRRFEANTDLYFIGNNDRIELWRPEDLEPIEALSQDEGRTYRETLSEVLDF